MPLPHLRGSRSPLLPLASVATVLAAGLVAVAPASAAPTDLLISEYVEGSSNNKALEIWNGTGAPVSLAGYSLQVHFIGSTTATTFPLAGSATVAPGDVWVLAHSSASAALLAQADQTTGAGLWNGDDAIVLAKDGVPVDSLGQVGVDPGSEWGSGLTSTADNTLRRQSTVTTGDTVTSDAFDPAAQWDGYANDTVDGVGAHPGRPGDPPPPPPAEDLCTVPATPVPAVQGPGPSSPLVGQKVVVRGTVTANLAGMDGFAVQDAGDGDPATSDGVFVFVPAANTSARAAAQALVPGQVVAVRGTVKEFTTLTEIDAVESLTVCGSAAVPAPTTYTLPEPVDGDLERVEGMLTTLTADGGLTVQQNFFLGRYGQLTLGSGGRRFQPTNQHPAGSPEAIALAAANKRALVVLDDATSRQNPVPIPFLDGDVRRAGDTTSSVTGVLDFGPVSSTSVIRDYRLQATRTPSFTNANLRTTAPEEVGGNLQVASFNVLNYFTTLVSQDPRSRGANTEAERERQLTKIVQAMAAVDADVVGLMEVENLPGTDAVQSLVDALNAEAGEQRYAAVVEPATADTGSDAIKVAMIYRPGVVTPVGSAMRDNAAINDRPTLAQAFRLDRNGEVLNVVVNHFKSKGSCPTGGADADQGDGQGCWNAKRVQQAEQLLTFIGRVEAASGDSDTLVIGDLNAYAMEDPIRALRAGGLVDEIRRHMGPKAYSYVFDGQSGYLDHGLASPTADRQVVGATEWHINADEPSVIDYNTEFKPQDLYTPTPYRSSDHDPVVLGIDLGRCQFLDDAVARVRTLRGDCTTSSTVTVPDGWTLDGAGHSITAYDPEGGTFTGAVVRNAGAVAHVRHLTVRARGLATACHEGAARLRGILLDGASGSVTGSTVADVRQDGSGCQEGVAIEVRNAPFDSSGPDATDLPVTVSGNTVTGYQKAGIVVNGSVLATVAGNTVTGLGPVGYIAQNGVQLGFGARGTVESTAMSANNYTGADTACGLLLYQADGVRQRRNTFAGNEQDLCNAGRGGGAP